MGGNSKCVEKPVFDSTDANQWPTIGDDHGLANFFAAIAAVSEALDRLREMDEESREIEEELLRMSREPNPFDCSKYPFSL